jgi:hypothetical protein
MRVWIQPLQRELRTEEITMFNQVLQWVAIIWCILVTILSAVSFWAVQNREAADEVDDGDDYKENPAYDQFKQNMEALRNETPGTQLFAFTFTYLLLNLPAALLLWGCR